MKIEKRINEIVNRLNKTKEERKPDLKVNKIWEGLLLSYFFKFIQ